MSLLCQVPGCRRSAYQKYRLFVRRYCTKHTRRAQTLGHPEARKVNSAKGHRHYRKVLQYINRALVPGHPDHDRVLAALDGAARVMDMRPSVIRPRKGKGKGTRIDRLTPESLAQDHFNRLKRRGVTPAMVLASAASMWRLDERNPGWIPDNRCLSYAIGRAVFKLAPFRRRMVKPTPDGKLHHFYARDQIPGLASYAVGERLRRECGGMIIKLARLESEGRGKAARYFYKERTR